jgi:hypothetical protein
MSGIVRTVEETHTTAGVRCGPPPPDSRRIAGDRPVMTRNSMQVAGRRIAGPVGLPATPILSWAPIEDMAFLARVKASIVTGATVPEPVWKSAMEAAARVSTGRSAWPQSGGVH